MSANQENREGIPAEAPLRVSACVIIPTKNRPLDLVITLRSLFRQTVLPRELVIVDQSAARDSRDAVDEFYRALPSGQREAVRLLYIHDPAITGAATARNAAMDAAGQDYWVFLDDDVIMEPDFLEQMLLPLQGDAEIRGVGGIITNYSRPAFTFRFFHGLFARGPFHDGRQRIYWRAEALRQTGLVPVSRLGGGLMAFRAAEVRYLRFDAQLRATSEGEDVEFCSQLPAGTRLQVNPRARLEHKKTPVARSGDHWLRAEARANTYLYRRLWRNRLRHRLCYFWLMSGYAMVAALASVKKLSAEPWRALLAGMRDSRNTKPKL